MLQKIEKYQHFIEQAIQEHELPSNPKNLYQPIEYFLNLGGKRMRPVLCLMACELFSQDFTKAKESALAIELFHNFTLIHDDIMDAAPLRRGQETVHEKWNQDIAILCGDSLLIEAYKSIATLQTEWLREILADFNQTASEVCEGQQMDMDFESRNDVTIDEYIEMIRLKTAVLLGFSLKTGALIGGSDSKSAIELYEFGVNLGIAFQIQDDLLDVYADQAKFGKQIAGDIVSQKQTYLLIKAYELANEDQKMRLDQAFKEENKAVKISEVKQVYQELEIVDLAKSKTNEFYTKAMKNLERLEVKDNLKSPLKNLSSYLLGRDN